VAGGALRNLTRSRSHRIVAGVAGGLAARLGVDPILLRITFGVLAFAGGTGVLLYGLLWVFVPLEPEAGTAPTASEAAERSRPATFQQAVALGLITLGVLFLLRGLGLWFGDALVWPMVLAAAGSAVVWTRGDGESRPWSTGATSGSQGRASHGRASPGPASAGRASGAERGPRMAFLAAMTDDVSPVRVVVGTLLIGGAIAGFLAANDALVAVRDLGLAVVAALVGVALLFGPWLWRLADQLGRERRDRIRSEERADLAAHLHDSVLQTLALIQRSSDQPRRMVALARRQERELRSWLYGTAADPNVPVALDEAVAELAEEIEATHDLTVEVVVVGQAPVDDRVRALLAAAREACTNAAKHAEVAAVDVYVEVEDTQVTAFVRDRGRGFDPAAVAADRQGIRRSIVGRLERHGGRASVWSVPGEGTEVELCVPRPRGAPAPGGSVPGGQDRASSPSRPEPEPSRAPTPPRPEPEPHRAPTPRPDPQADRAPSAPRPDPDQDGAS
jgi:phage shock protein PspC (stress-responsive transcriptional regulator)/anti-sigma regulatory factor (Ser/Thr protein kinase)